MSEIRTNPKAPSPRVKKPSVSLKNSSNSLSCHEVTEGVFPPAGDGRNCNGCNLHDASRVQELLHRLKESYVDKKNKVNSFGIIN